MPKPARYGFRIDFALVALLGVVFAGSSEQAKTAPAPTAGLLRVASVWGVRQHRFCSAAVVRSIEVALRAYQNVEAHAFCKCLPMTASRVINETGYNPHDPANVEVIKFTSPARFSSRFSRRLQYPYKGDGETRTSLVYEIIADAEKSEPENLVLNLGKLYPKSYTGTFPAIMFAGERAPTNFLRLDAGECERASVPAHASTGW